MCKFIDILDKVNPEHRVRFVGWSSDFIENETWPSVLEFRVYKTFTDTNGIVNVILTEGDDVTWVRVVCNCFTRIGLKMPMILNSFLTIVR